MQEAFEIQFTRAGAPLPVTGLLPGEGITLNGETDAGPLGVALNLDPISAGTRVMFENIQRNQGWIGEHIFRLNLSLAGDRLRFEGFRPGLLPPGTYRLSVFVSGYVFHNQVREFTIPGEGTASVTFPEKPERRQVVLTRSVDQFDPLALAIVQASSLDGLPMTDWLTSPRAREARKACALNVLAKLQTRIGGQPPLAEGVIRFIFADVDRLYAELEPRFARRFLSPDSGFGEDSVIHTTHLKLLQRIPNGPAHRLDSLRESVATTSLQIVLALPDDTGAPQFADIDIDLGNPFVSPLGFFIHIGELIDPGKTDHLALFSRLKDDPVVEDFLFYKVITS